MLHFLAFRVKVYWVKNTFGKRIKFFIHSTFFFQKKKKFYFFFHTVQKKMLVRVSKSGLSRTLSHWVCREPLFRGARIMYSEPAEDEEGGEDDRKCATCPSSNVVTWPHSRVGALFWVLSAGTGWLSFLLREASLDGRLLCWADVHRLFLDGCEPGVPMVLSTKNSKSSSLSLSSSSSSLVPTERAPSPAKEGARSGGNNNKLTCVPDWVYPDGSGWYAVRWASHMSPTTDVSVHACLSLRQEPSGRPCVSLEEKETKRSSRK